MRPWPDWVDALTVGSILTPLLGVVAIVGVVAAVQRWIHPTARRVIDFLDDWQGRPARPGHAAEPGFPERVRLLEVSVAEVRANVKPNGGSSAHDLLTKSFAELRELVVDLMAEVGESNRTTNELERRVEELRGDFTD